MKYNTSYFIQKAKEIHGNKYDYSKVEYVNSTTKVCIICPEHGEFWQQPASHLSNRGCPKCARERCESGKRLTTEVFIERAKALYGDKYIYTKVEYKGYETPVCIVCPEHGEFWQTPHHFLDGHSCHKCNKWIRYNNESFIAKAKEIYGDKYDYSDVVYKDIKTPIDIICPIHGKFKQNPHSHLNGHGCPECTGKKRYTFEHFLKRAREVHGDKYEYREIEKVENLRSRVGIICPKHGYFEMSINYHINGKHGCPLCDESKLETEVRVLLEKNKIPFEREANASYGFKWLITNKKLNNSQSLDFYLPNHNLVIECHGLQHFQPVEKFGGEEAFKKCRILDERKYNECIKHGMNVLYYTTYKNVEYPHPLIHSKKELLEEIKKYPKESLVE